MRAALLEIADELDGIATQLAAALDDDAEGLTDTGAEELERQAEALARAPRLLSEQLARPRAVLRAIAER